MFTQDCPPAQLSHPNRAVRVPKPTPRLHLHSARRLGELGALTDVPRPRVGLLAQAPVQEKTVVTRWVCKTMYIYLEDNL